MRLYFFRIRIAGDCIFIWGLQHENARFGEIEKTKRKATTHCSRSAANSWICRIHRQMMYQTVFFYVWKHLPSSSAVSVICGSIRSSAGSIDPVYTYTRIRMYTRAHAQTKKRTDMQRALRHTYVYAFCTYTYAVSARVHPEAYAYVRFRIYVGLRIYISKYVRLLFPRSQKIDRLHGEALSQIRRLQTARISAATENLCLDRFRAGQSCSAEAFSGPRQLPDSNPKP